MSNVPGSAKVSEVSSEATYLLPKVSSQYFSEFFQKFDQKLEDLEVHSYGVSMTTLEEVFLKVENNPDAEFEGLDDIKFSTKEQQEEEKNLEDYSIANKQIEGSVTIFWLHFIALIIKKFFLTKRNIKGFIIDLFIPTALIITGFGLTKIKILRDSPQRILDIDLFPSQQRLIYNTIPVIPTGSTDDPSDLIGLLSNQNNFNFTGDSNAYGDTQDDIEAFDNLLLDASLLLPLSPFRFGHYFFHTTDYSNHQYKIVSFVNSTSQDAHVVFPHLMYEAILRKSIGSNLNFTTVNDPMPIVQIWKDNEDSNNTYFIGLVLGISLALAPTTIMGYLLSEKINLQLHQQIISGMNKPSYWLSNYIIDIIKMFFTVFIAII